MKAVVAAFNQEKALVGAFSVITNLRMQLFEALFQAVLCSYIQDEQLSAPVPLPSHRVAELSFVLKALTTLISSLKRGGGGGGEGESRTWAQVIGLYPHLVTATSIRTASVTSRLQEALHQYQGLLRPPTPVATVNISINGESSS